MRTGIYPGSFNPIHKGHIALAEYILRECKLDEIWFLVSPNNPLKRREDLWDEHLRLALTAYATRHNPQLKASDFEFALPRPSYTIHTLEALTRAYPKREFTLIIGSDNLACFTQWKDYQKILAHYPLAVYPRQGDDIEGLRAQYPQVKFLQEAPLLPISSTEIRARLQRGERINDMTEPYYGEEDIERLWKERVITERLGESLRETFT